MGWFMQVMLNRLLPSSPVLLPSCPSRVTIHFWYLTFSGTQFWYPYRDSRDTPFHRHSHHNIPPKSLQRSVTISMAKKDLNSHLYTSPLDMERKVTAGADRQLNSRVWHFVPFSVFC